MKIYVVFRYDDFSAVSNMRLEEEIIKFFGEKNIGFTIGAVPFIKKGDLFDGKPADSLPLTEEKKLLLKQALYKNNCEIALHGYSHLPVKSYFRYTEFEKKPLKEQLDLIKEGKDYLESILSARVETFIPPFNSYDRNTVRALKELRVSIISSGLWGYIPLGGINLIPSTCALEYFEHTLSIVNRYVNLGPIIVVRFHPYEFLDRTGNLDRAKLDRFKQTIEWCLSQKDLQIVTVKKLADLLKGRFSGREFFFNKVLEKTIRLTNGKPTQPYSRIYWRIPDALRFTMKSLLISSGQ